MKCKFTILNSNRPNSFENIKKMVEKAESMDLTFAAELGSSPGIVQYGEPMLEDLVGSPSFELVDEAEVLSGAATPICRHGS